METVNKFLVSANGEAIVLLRPVPQRLSKTDALLLAAWLVAVADDDDGFEAQLLAIEST